MRVAKEQDAKEKKERMREQAFLGWLFYRMQPTDKRHVKMSYEDWLRNLGLSEKGEKVENIEELKKRALKIAEDIVNRDKGRRREE